MSRDVVVLRALGLGDLLTGLPALHAIRRQFSADHVTLCTNSALVLIAELADVANRVVPVAPFELDALPPLRCDVAVNLHGRGPQSSRRLLDLRPARLIAFACDEVPQTLRSPPWQGEEHEVSRWCRLLDAHGIAAYRDDLALPMPRQPAVVSAATVVHPGAAAGARRWPADRFAEVARRLSADGHEVVVTGTVDEQRLAADVCTGAGLPATANLAGRTDALQLAALVSAARLVVSGDTGVAHLATAYECPSVVLFGPTSPALWGPPPRAWHRVLWAGSDGDPHASDVDPGLATIEVDTVLQAAADLPTSGLRQSRGRSMTQPTTGDRPCQSHQYASKQPTLQAISSTVYGGSRRPRGCWRSPIPPPAN